MKVIITEPASNRLRFLFDFYSQYIPEKKNKEILVDIFKRVRSLKHHPERGNIETNLMEYPYEYRFILERNCKIIYRIERILF